MTVAELVAKLQTLDQDMPIFAFPYLDEPAVSGPEQWGYGPETYGYLLGAED